MFLNLWSLALTLLSLTVICLSLMTVRTSVRVLRYWDVSSDSNLQIKLENETWLAATLVKYALSFQIVSLSLFSLAADNFSEVIAGAMCATGALTANEFGIYALITKIAGVFIYGLWIVIHQIDISSEDYPLLKVKFVYLVFLFPLLCLDVSLQTLYIAGLEPDIITSCCAVVFGSEKGGGGNLLQAFDKQTILVLFYGLAVVIAISGFFLLKRWHILLACFYAALWAVYFFVGMAAVTTFFSSYIYAMPYHRCPFCILKPEYNYIGFLLYGALISASFFGISQAITSFFKSATIAEVIKNFRKSAIRISILMLFLFVIASSYHYVVYKVFGGES